MSPFSAIQSIVLSVTYVLSIVLGGSTPSLATIFSITCKPCSALGHLVIIGHNSIHQTGESIYSALSAFGHELLVDVQRGARE